MLVTERVSVLGLYWIPASVLSASAVALPLFASTNVRKKFASVPSVTVLTVLATVARSDVAALPVVSWFNVPITKSIVPSESWYSTEIPVSVLLLNIAPTVSCISSVKSISEEPSKETPWIVLAVDRVAALPDVFWLPVVFTPGKFIFAVPSNDTPPIVLAVSNAVAVPAFPVVSWFSVPTVKSSVPSASWYSTVIPDSVFPVTIPPTISCTASSVTYLLVEPSVKSSVVNPVRFLVVKKTPKPMCACEEHW